MHAAMLRGAKTDAERAKLAEEWKHIDLRPGTTDDAAHRCLKDLNITAEEIMHNIPRIKQWLDEHPEEAAKMDRYADLGRKVNP
jgi:hypothetical protein